MLPATIGRYIYHFLGASMAKQKVAQKQQVKTPEHHKLTETEILLVQVVDFLEQYIAEEVAELGDRMEKIGKLLLDRINSLEASMKRGGSKSTKRAQSNNGGAHKAAVKAVKMAKKSGKTVRKVARKR
jgi:hypothetical protein